MKNWHFYLLPTALVTVISCGIFTIFYLIFKTQDLEAFAVIFGSITVVCILIYLIADFLYKMANILEGTQELINAVSKLQGEFGNWFYENDSIKLPDNAQKAWIHLSNTMDSMCDINDEVGKPFDI